MKQQMPHGRLKGKMSVYLLFLICWLAHSTTYLGRLNYTACPSEIFVTEGWSKGEAGFIATAFLPPAVNGRVGDKMSTKLLVACGWGNSGIINLLFLLTVSPVAAAVLWSINDLYSL